MVSLNELLERVDIAFEARPADIVGWVDPNPERSPDDDAYSRVTNPERWRLIGARADAWTHTLTELGLARVDESTNVEWVSERLASNLRGRTDLIVPTTPGALCLVFARLSVEDAPDAGVVVGVGNPAELLVMVPDCGCDACDSGSADALEELDEHIINVVGGTYRRLSRGSKSVTATQNGWHTMGMNSRQVKRMLARPALQGARGWSEQTGPSWLTA